jgi:hypothetical protein
MKSANILPTAEKAVGIKKIWFNDFFSIPEQFRCNPFDYSPTGDMFYADKRNVENLKKSLAVANQQIKKGKAKAVKTMEELTSFLENM